MIPLILSAVKKQRGKMNRKRLWIIRGIIAMMAMAFIVSGITGGEQAEVWKKGANICLQCIGIG